MIIRSIQFGYCDLIELCNHMLILASRFWAMRAMRHYKFPFLSQMVPYETAFDRECLPEVDVRVEGRQALQNNKSDTLIFKNWSCAAIITTK